MGGEWVCKLYLWFNGFNINVEFIYFFYLFYILKYRVIFLGGY